MTAEKTDEEVICQWMGWVTVPHWRMGTKAPLNVYWDDRPMFQCHTTEEAERIVAAMNSLVALSLDRLHEVEARLSDEQWEAYEAIYTADIVGKGSSYAFRRHVHATAAQKIAALAAVIRAEAAK